GFSLPAGTRCVDGNECTYPDTCNGAGRCVTNLGDQCEDDNPCTRNVCSPGFPALGPHVACLHSEYANDPLLTPSCPGDCTGLPDGTRCVADGLPCTIDPCQGGTCVAGPPSCPEASGCGAEGTCTAFGCVPSGLPSLCQDDGNPCTADRCDGAQGCVHQPLT